MPTALRISLTLSLALACACGEDAPPVSSAPQRAPRIDLSAVPLADTGLPDPCAVLRSAEVDVLLVRPLEAEPFRHMGLCLIQAARGEAPEPQVSAALELAELDSPLPTDQDAYWTRYGEGVRIAGAAREDLVELDATGQYALWFPHADGSLTLTAFFGDHALLSIEVHGVERDRALDWAHELALAIVRHSATPHGDPVARR